MRAVAAVATALGALALSGPGLGQHTLTLVEENGPPDNRIDLLVMGDGYTADEQDDAAADLLEAAENLFDHTPYTEYRPLFNIALITTISPESGADHPAEDAYVESFFDCEYDYNGLDQLIWCDYAKILAVAAEILPQFDVVILVVNDIEYGGSGGAVAVTSRSNWAVDIPAHELAHTLSGLGDEYEAPYPGWIFDDIYANISPTAVRADLKWEIWVDPATPLPTPDGAAIDDHTPVGAYEGAMYQATGLFRPAPSCLMRDLSSELCPICGEATVLTFYGFVEPVDAYAPTDAELEGSAGDSFELSLDVVTPIPDTMVVEWSIDGRPLAGADGSIVTLPIECLAGGAHAVEAHVRDTTALVRSDPDALSAQQITWSLTRLDDGAALDCPELWGDEPDAALDGGGAGGSNGSCDCAAAPGAPPTVRSLFEMLAIFFV